MFRCEAIFGTAFPRLWRPFEEPSCFIHIMDMISNMMILIDASPCQYCYLGDCSRLTSATPARISATAIHTAADKGSAKNRTAKATPTPVCT